MPPSINLLRNRAMRRNPHHVVQASINPDTIDFKSELHRFDSSFDNKRSKTWELAADFIVKNNLKQLVETGCYHGSMPDGGSTILLAILARDTGGHLDSYELNPRNINIALTHLKNKGLAKYVTFHLGDSVCGLAKRSDPIEFAYLDSFDCGLGPDFSPCQNHQLYELEAALPLFKHKAALMMDDNIGQNGKTFRSLQRLKRTPFSIISEGYQVLLVTENSQTCVPHKICVLTGHLSNYGDLAAETIYRNRTEYCIRHGYDLKVAREVREKFKNDSSHVWGFSWSRLEMMYDLVSGGAYEWVWCVGCDTLVTNFTIRLEDIIADAETKEAENNPLPECPPFPDSPAPPSVIKWVPPQDHVTTGKKHLLICGERVVPMQSDSFLVRGSPEGANYLKDILSHYNLYKTHVWVENQAMIDLRYKHAAITYMVPQWKLNSVDCSRWHGLRPQYKDNCDCFGNRAMWQHGDFLIHWPAATVQQRMEWVGEYSKKIKY